MVIETLQPEIEPTRTIKLWSPNTIGTLTFFAGFPAGITLASINWFKMDKKLKAYTHILVGVIGMVAIYFLPDGITRSLALLINLGFVAYIRNQMKADIESLTHYKVENPNWFSGFLTGMAGWVMAAVILIIIVFLEPIIPGTASYYYERGVDYSEKGEFESAISNYSKAIERDPDDIFSYHNRGLSYINLGEYDLAIADLNKTLEIDPTYDNAYYNRALAYKGLGQIDNAIKDFQKVLELTSDPELLILSEQELINIETFAASSVNESTEHFNTGETYYQNGDYTNALAEFTRAIELDPNYVAAYHHRSIVYANLEEYDLALDDIEKAILLSPDNSLLYHTRGLLYSDIGDFEQALASQNIAISIAPQFADAYLERGAAYGNLGDHKNAFADFNKAIEIDPNNPFSFYNRGMAYYMMENYKQAINDFNKAIELNPNVIDAYNYRGVSYGMLGNNNKAIDDFNKILELDPGYVMAYLNRGITYISLGRTDDAIQDFEHFLDFSADPEINKQVEEMLQELRAQ